jgi:hypothetical protein
MVSAKQLNDLEKRLRTGGREKRIKCEEQEVWGKLKLKG